MKKIFFLTLLFAVCLTVSVDAQLTAKVYEDPNIERLVLRHKKIAILPANVTVKDTKSNKKNRMSPEEMKSQEEDYRSAFQNSMYAWMMRMKGKGRVTQEIQDVETTNALLIKNGLDTKDAIAAKTMDEVAEILGVDAVFNSKVITTSTFDKGAAVALAIIVGVGVRTGEADVFVKLYDKGGKMIWSFDRTVGGTYVSDPDDMVEFLMKRVSKRFPYKVKRN